ncbi:LAGLIDADG family homing endonuclease [Patescibacteria group bacterium]|nr:LAGLIDADG family homing endonuclease [Patescibacteria group bacterium]
MNKDYSWLKLIPQNIGNYISGFVDGEGSFNVSLRKREDHSLGWQIVLTLNVAQRDKTILALMKQYLKCGRLQERKDGVWYYVISNPNAIQERIIPFFKKYSFLSSSKKKISQFFHKLQK